MSIISHFDVLVKHNLRVIPLKHNTKMPMCYGWSLNWIHQEARKKIEDNANCNIGLLLGDIVDVEGDDFSSNEFVKKIIGDYKHPSYQSERSVHHLFLSPDKDLRILKHKKIEFRGWGHQSVLPPSRIDNVQYRWESILFPIPVMPDSLLNFYFEVKKNYFLKKKATLKQIKIAVCFNCRNKIKIHRERLTNEIIAFRSLSMNWSCNKCREIDLRPIVRKINRRKNAKW